MNQAASFVTGYSPEDTDRINTHIQKLLKHLKPENFAIAGGLSIRYHLRQKRVDYPNRPFNDLDIVVNKVEDVPPSVTVDFLLAEYHRPKSNGYFIVKLVDQESRTKSDIFPFWPSSPERVVQAPFFGGHVNLISLEDQLVKVVTDTSRAGEDWKLEPKHFENIDYLVKGADMELAGKLWIEKRYAELPATLDEAIASSKKMFSEHRDWFQPIDHSKDKPTKCDECNPPPGYKLAPMGDVFKAMGWE